MNVWIKICGITNKEDAILCVDAGVDAIGFIFASSPRRIEKEAVKEIVSSIPPQIVTVGVFVNEEIDKMLQVAEYCSLHYLQLHGDETPQDCEKLRSLGRKVIKVFRVRDGINVNRIAEYQDKIDFVHLDTYVEKVYGGSGEKFNWDLSLTVKERIKIPLIVAGGLTSENVCDLISRVKPYGVDVSSGVESFPGKKDKEKVMKFVEAVKTCTRQF